MAAYGSVVLGFLMQNSLYLIFVSLTTLTVVVLSTYYFKRSLLSSRANVQEVRKTCAKTPVVNDDQLSSASDANTTTKEPEVDGDEADDEAVIDPVTYCEHIQGEIKKVRQKVATRKICEGLTKEQLAEEKERQREQLSQIFKLMQEQKDRFGINSMEEMQEQMRLYANF